jgi:GNAT superfamily N-acetyltransferase
MSKEKISYKHVNIDNFTEKTKKLFIKQMFDLHYYPNSKNRGDLFKSNHEVTLLSDLKKGCNFFCIFSNNLLVGSAKVYIINQEFVLDHIFVRPDFRKKGFGKKLMIRVSGYAKKHKFTNVIFHVANSKMHNISKKIVARDVSRSSTRYKYLGNTKEINHNTPSVINMKKIKRHGR